MHQLPFRQIHLDFHTSGAIPAIGENFHAEQWLSTLQMAHVNSVTLFAVCHHGWHYHPTAIGTIHPNLKFDLLRAQFDTLKSAGINAPVYISAGLNQQLWDQHPEWRVQAPEQKAANLFDPHFHLLCFNTTYLELLCAEIQETAKLFPNADGIFLDIISAPDCICAACVAKMRAAGIDAANPEERRKFQAGVLDNYYRRTLAALREVAPGMPIFQNSGNVQRGERRFFDYVSHLELESLPTGGWGYDHFPMSALAAAHSGLDYLGMTGKFHTTWGEFGGYKDPNALRYECAAMLAFGSKCSVGDQLHPSGALDESTYRIIGEAYSEVEKCEPWCSGVTRIADIAVLSSDALHHGKAEECADTGACRMLLESHFLFDLIDGEDEFGAYRLLILPDNAEISPALLQKLRQYVAQGGKLLLTGRSGLDADGRPLFDFGARVEGESVYRPEYIQPEARLMPSWCQSPLVIYQRGMQAYLTDGESLGKVYAPYFNRTWEHFCSHQHTPNELTPSATVLGARKGAITYIAYPLFTQYREMGQVVLRRFLANLTRETLGVPSVEVENLPSTGRITFAEQTAQNRLVLHLLYADMATRGGSPANPAGVTVVEDLPVLSSVRITLRTDRTVTAVKQQPAGSLIDYTVNDDGALEFAIPPFSCHTMIELSYHKR